MVNKRIYKPGRLYVCCGSVWQWRHVRVFLRRWAECGARVHQHARRSLGRGAWRFLRSRREPARIVRRRRNRHRVETRAANPRPVDHVTFDLCAWPRFSLGCVAVTFRASHCFPAMANLRCTGTCGFIAVWCHVRTLSADVQTPLKRDICFVAATTLSDPACLLLWLCSGPRGGVCCLGHFKEYLWWWWWWWWAMQEWTDRSSNVV